MFIALPRHTIDVDDLARGARSRLFLDERRSGGGRLTDLQVLTARRDVPDEPHRSLVGLQGRLPARTCGLIPVERNLQDGKWRLFGCQGGEGRDIDHLHRVGLRTPGHEQDEGDRAEHHRQ